MLLISSERGAGGAPLPGVTRRFLAFWLDFVFAIFAIAPWFGLVGLAVEWRRTGVFAWHIERSTPAPGDAAVTVVSVLATFGLLLVYFLLPNARTRPSPGECVFGYQVLPDNPAEWTLKRATLRTLLGSVALAAWPLAPFVFRRRKEGKFWLDRVSHTHAVKLE